MAGITVKGINSLLDVAVSAKNNTQSDNATESFDRTLNSMRTENTKKTCENDDVTDKKDAITCTNEKFKHVNRKEQVKTEDEETVTDEQIAMVSEEVIGQMKEVLMEKYNISEEQLTAMIEETGLTEESLYNPAELIKLVMKLEGVENQADMLTNSEFASNLKEILSKLEDLKSVADFQIVESQNDNDINMTDELVDATVEQKEKAEVAECDAIPENEQNVQSVMTGGTSVENGNNENSDSLLKKDEDKNTNDGDTKESMLDLNVNTHDFVQKLTEDLSAKVGEVKANDIVRQVVEQTSIQAKQGVTSLEMQLYPEHLGKVLVQIVSNEGTITAQITAESEAAKTALESQLTLLKESLVNQGVKVENVEVTIASHAFEQNMQGEAGSEQNSAQNKRSRRNTDMFFGETDDDEKQEIEQSVMGLNGSTVSYLA